MTPLVQIQYIDSTTEEQYDEIGYQEVKNTDVFQKE